MSADATDEQEKALLSPPSEALTGSAPPPASDEVRNVAPRKRRVTTVSIVVAVIAAAWVGAGLYLLWHELTETRARLEQEAAAAQQETARLGERLDKVESQLSDVVSGDLEELHAQQHDIQALLDALREKVERDPQSWVTAETAYLLRIANDRLHLDADAATALAALEAADQRLADIDDPTLFEVRRALAQEIAALRALPAADVTGMALRLGAVNDAIERLPFPLAPGTVVVTPSEPSEYQGWRQIVHDVWQALRSLVVIKHKDQADQVLLTPDERQLLQQNLRLTLEAAQVALIRRDDKIFHDQLRRAEGWIRRYFDAGAPATQTALQELARMQETNLAPTLPDLSASLRALEDWQTQRHNKKKSSDGGAP